MQFLKKIERKKDQVIKKHDVTIYKIIQYNQIKKVTLKFEFDTTM